MRTKLSNVKKVVKHERGHEGKPSSNFHWLRCDIEAAKHGTVIFV